MNKVLIITYYWPPSAGSGVQRWLKFAKYLPQFGWEPIIFTPENPAFEQQDPSLLKDVSPHLEVLKLPIREPLQLLKKFSKNPKKQFKQGVVRESDSWVQKLMIWIRGNMFIPDPRVFWVKPAIKLLRDLLEANDINTIVTTGPPHSMHLIGLGLKRKKPDLRWVADFRDPWSRWDMLNHLHVGTRARKKHRRLEKQVMQIADRIVTVSQNLVNSLEGVDRAEVEVITNGFDPDDFSAPPSTSSGKFEISHFGLLNELRDPIPVLEAIKILAKQDSDFNKHVVVKLVGTVNKRITSRIQQDEVLKNLVIISPPVTHDEVIKAYYQAALLLVVSDDSQVWQLPGKLFECMAVGRPILALGTKNSELDLVLKKTGAGKLFEKDQSEEIMHYLAGIYVKFKEGVPVKVDVDYTKFTRKKLTEELSRILNNL